MQLRRLVVMLAAFASSLGLAVTTADAKPPQRPRRPARTAPCPSPTQRPW